LGLDVLAVGWGAFAFAISSSRFEKGALVTGATGFGGGADPKGVEENEKLILSSPVVMLMVRQESTRIGSQVVQSSHGEVGLRNLAAQHLAKGSLRDDVVSMHAQIACRRTHHLCTVWRVAESVGK